MMKNIAILDIRGRTCDIVTIFSDDGVFKGLNYAFFLTPCVDLSMLVGFFQKFFAQRALFSHMRK